MPLSLSLSLSHSISPSHFLSPSPSLSLTHTGSQREELMELLVPVAANTEGADITEVSLAALSLGMVFVGTCNDEVRRQEWRLLIIIRGWKRISTHLFLHCLSLSLPLPLSLSLSLCSHGLSLTNPHTQKNIHSFSTLNTCPNRLEVCWCNA